MTPKAREIGDFRFTAESWTFADLRFDIPPLSFGSDAMNPHTQYSNPVAVVDGEMPGVGCGFTLGAGNEMICDAARALVEEIDGRSVDDLIESGPGFYEVLANPRQLRWLSPYAGVPLMAAGVVVNTVIDAMSKEAGLPAWEYLARLPTATLMQLLPLRLFPPSVPVARVHDLLDQGLEGLGERVTHLKEIGLPVYFTTWIGHHVDEIVDQISAQRESRGINRFKLKVGPDIDRDIPRLEQIRSRVSEDVRLSVDANQTLDSSQAREWLRFLSSAGFEWLEEPYPPDHVELFADLVAFKRESSLSCEIVTGENCPNAHTAAALMRVGIDRYQADPCRMMGLVDGVAVTAMAAVLGTMVTPHAGGSALDELSPHIQLFNLARLRTDLTASETLTENVGFTSRYFASPTMVDDGRATTPRTPGLLVGFAEAAQSVLKDYRRGASWLAL